MYFNNKIKIAIDSKRQQGSRRQHTRSNDRDRRKRQNPPMQMNRSNRQQPIQSPFSGRKGAGPIQG